MRGEGRDFATDLIHGDNSIVQMEQENIKVFHLFCVHEYICEPDCSKSKLIKLLPNRKVTYVNGWLKKIEPLCRILGRVDL